MRRDHRPGHYIERFFQSPENPFCLLAALGVLVVGSIVELGDELRLWLRHGREM